MTSDPNKYCVWTVGSANDHLTGCGEIVGDVEVTQYGDLENCPRCDDPILETNDYESEA